MTLITFKSKQNVCLSTKEIKEILQLMEHQETNEKFTNTELEIFGDYADISVKVDSQGDLILEV